MRASSIEITILEHPNDPNTEEFWRIGCCGANPFDTSIGVWCYHYDDDGNETEIPWKDVPAPKREYAMNAFRAAGFSELEINTQSPRDEDD